MLIYLYMQFSPNVTMSFMLQKSKSETLFAPSVPKKFDETKHYKDRYVNSYSQHLTRDGSGYKNHRYMNILSLICIYAQCSCNLSVFYMLCQS